VVVIIRFQSTPLREGRPDLLEASVDLIGVSIHAPARGATIRTAPISSMSSGFNPRPCARGDSVAAFSASMMTGFNPRPCARGDPGLLQECRRHKVSIHAPARGATPTNSTLIPRMEFQSTPLREGRLLTYQISLSPMTFQSTPLREGRLMSPVPNGLQE